MHEECNGAYQPRSADTVPGAGARVAGEAALEGYFCPSGLL